MKKILWPGVLLALLFIFSCSKDEFTEEDATQAQKELISYQDSIDQVRDSLNMVGGIIQYSVSVVPIDGGSAFAGGYKSGKAAEFLAGAVVSVSQHGVVKTDTTGDSGIAVFHDLRVGTVNVNVRVDNYTSVNFIAEIRPEDDPDVNVYYDVLRHAATMVPVFSLTEGTSTIEGRVTYESNLTNQAPEVASDVTVIAMVDVDDSEFIDNYFLDIWGDELEKYSGKIIQIAYTDLTATAVTDANGEYSLTMPSTADGLPIMMEIGDMAVDQQLLMNTVHGQPVNGVQTIRTIFSTDVSTASDVPTVPAAYVEFSAPTGSVANQPDAPATAEAVVSESGLVSINITDQGSGYTQPPIIKITGDGEGAEAVAYISEGKVTSIEITEPGHGYTPGNVTIDASQDKEGDDATATPVITYSIVDFSKNSGGLGYQTKPDVVISSSTGSGASGNAVMSGYITEFTVTNQGSGYVCPPDVVIEGSSGTDAVATATMTQYNPIYSIELTDNFTNTYETTPLVQINNVSTGSGASAVVQLSNSGEIDRIELTNAGLGYTEAPTIIISGGGGQGAVAYATLNGDGSINVSLVESGAGYTSDPTVEISAPPTGGTQAAGNAVRVFPIESITLTNPGSGYNINYNQGGFPDEYSNEPNVVIGGVTLADDEVIVRPNMSVESVGFTSFGDTPGNGYESAPIVSITPKCGYGNGATVLTEILYFVDRIDVLTGGSGYGYDADIEVTVITPPEGCEEQADFYINKPTDLGNGVLSEIELDESGEGYLAPPNVRLFYGGSEADNVEITAAVSNGSVNSFNILSNGGELVYSTSYSIVISTHVNGVVLTANANPESGRIAFVTISDPGEGYTTSPIVEFIRLDRFNNPVTSHNFTDAEATPIMEDGRVVGVEITNPGTGYYFEPDVHIYIPNYNQTAEGTPIIDPKGHITGVSIDNPGMGYVEPPTVTFSASVPGMGQDATGLVVIANGMVDNVTMTNMGDGYLGKNFNEGNAGIPVSFLPVGSALNTFSVIAGKSYVRDIYLGTGNRTIED